MTKPKFRKYLPLIISLFILLITIIITILGIKIYQKVTALQNKVFVENTNPKTAQNFILKSLKEKTPFNILLLGYGGGSHDGTFLTDSIILASINPASESATLITIPRDLWVSFEEKSKKINNAYWDGIKTGSPSLGGTLAKKAVEEVTGLPVSFFAAVDFDAFQQSIDLIGGVDVKVEKTFDDFEYPIPGKENDPCGKTDEELKALTISRLDDLPKLLPCRYEHLRFDAGTVHMNGETALKFVRSRHSLEDGTDFGRSLRQKNLIVAVKEKAMTLDFIGRAPFLLNNFANHFQTDLSIDDIKILTANAGELSKYKIKSLALTDENVLANSWSSDGQQILTSKEGVGKWEAVRAFIKSALEN